MAIRNNMTEAGISPFAAHAINGRVANNLTATGSTQATALALPGDINKVTSTPSSTGVIIPPANPGDSGIVFNGDGTNALLLYPPTGGKINALSTNTGYSIAAATPYCEWYCVDPLTYIASQSA